MRTADRLQSFTLIELVVVMIITGIVVATAATALRITGERLAHLKDSREKWLEVYRLEGAVQGDADRSLEVLSEVDGVRLKRMVGPDIVYHILANGVVRETGQVTDTFYVDISERESYYNGNTITTNVSPIDEWKWEAQIGETPVSFRFYKIYAADEKMRHEAILNHTPGR
ncbi:MAG: prepilin-type N-terminal cleavage/methylation domain-containing protein [Flavobacteriales bacterium]|nr:prepilin-type N-terminal cleavage/methylation domain-containing protein [Flavobacteriales bacterium]